MGAQALALPISALLSCWDYLWVGNYSERGSVYKVTNKIQLSKYL